MLWPIEIEKGCSMPRKILLVEDDAVIALSEAQVLKRHSYDVVMAHTGEKAEAEDISRRVQRGENIESAELTRYRKDGSPIRVRLSMGLIKEDGRTFGAVAIYKRTDG